MTLSTRRELSRSSLSKNISSTPDHITFITQDETSALWIGEYGRGLTRYDEQTKHVQHFNRKDTLSGFNDVDEYLFGHCISKDGLLWVAGLAGNVYTIQQSYRKRYHI
jgi:ligand-binding sensor domain-containing protein